MQLSYLCRLMCFALCSAGLLQLLLEALAWLAAPALLAQSGSMSARRVERFLFSLGILARLGPWLVVLGSLVPAYIRGEDNLSQERVGWLCMAGAVCVAGWSAFCLLRMAQSLVSTRRFFKLCRRAGTTMDGLPLLLHPSERPLLAVAGLFRSRIVVSRALLVPGHVSPDALDIALLHESAHARQRDNLKLAVLSLLPHVSLGTEKLPSLDHHWRLAAELAADEEGAMGRPERSVLLAELLVTMARESNQPVPRASFALLARADDLRVRVDRLLQYRPAKIRNEQAAAREGSDLHSGYALMLALLLLAALCYLGTALGHRAAEVLLHIG